MLVFAIIVTFLGGEVFGMGKSDGSKEEVESSVSKPAPVATPKAVRVEAPKAVAVSKPSDNKVLVTVNGITIKQSDVDKEIAPQKALMAARGNPVPDARVKQIEQRVVQMLVEKQIVKDKIASEGIVITDAQVQVEVENFAKQRGMSIEELEKTLLERSGISKAGFRSEMRMGLGFEKLMKKAMESERGKVTEADAKTYYDSNIARYTHEAQAQASHILVDIRGKDEEGKAAAKVEAEGYLKQIKDGSDFAALAKEHSSCPSSAKGGDLGKFEKGRMVPEFSEAAFSMKVGEVSDVVKTQFGYHIIKLTGMDEAGTATFEDEKANIIKQLESGKEREFTKKYIEGVKGKAKIEWAEGVKPTTNSPQGGHDPSVGDHSGHNH
jgi:peptidyl-prolyl cis-trans isomerase C